MLLQKKKNSIKSHCKSNIGWKSPETYWICINTDGVVAKSKIVCCEGLAKNCVKDCLSGFLKNIGIYNVTSVELWGIMEGLRFTQSKGYTRIQLQVDSQEVVNAINGKFDQLKGLRLIRKIKTTMDGFVEVKVVKIHKETNKCAETLTKYSLNLRGDKIEFMVCHSFSFNVILGDIIDMS